MWSRMEENDGSTCHSLLKYEDDEVYIFSNKSSCITFLSDIIP